MTQKSEKNSPKNGGKTMNDRSTIQKQTPDSYPASNPQKSSSDRGKTHTYFVGVSANPRFSLSTSLLAFFSYADSIRAAMMCCCRCRPRFL